MLFHVSKCKVMHIGKQNQQRQYFMHDQCLEVVCQEKDLGILISNDLKVIIIIIIIKEQIKVT